MANRILLLTLLACTGCAIQVHAGAFAGGERLTSGDTEPVGGANGGGEAGIYEKLYRFPVMAGVSGPA